MRQDVRFGLRLLRKQSFSWLVLILGLAIAAAMLSLTFHTSLYLYKDRPDWVETQQPLYTLGGKTPLGKLAGLSSLDLSRLSALDMIEQVGLVGKLSSYEFRIDDRQFESAPALFSENFFNLLIPTFARNKDWDGVWISHQFWQGELRGADVIGRTIHTDSPEFSLVISGILPEGVQLDGAFSSDIWIPKQYQAQLIKLKISSPMPPAMLKRIKANLASQTQVYFAILSSTATRAAHVVDLVSDLQNATTVSNGSVTLHNRTLPWQVIPGFILQPEQKEALSRLLTICSYLCLGIGMVILLSLISQFWNLVITRKQELELRLSVGASIRSLIAQLFVEQTVFLVCVATLAGVFIYVSNHYLLDPIMQGSESSIWISVVSLFVSLLCTLGAFAFCLVVPLMSLYGKALFSRAKSGQLTPLQRRLISLNMYMQCGFTLLLSGIAYSMYIGALTLQNQVSVDQSVTQIAIKNRGNNLSWQVIKQHLSDADLTDDVALLSERFTLPANLSVSASAESVNAQQHNIAAYFVSDNFFYMLDNSEQNLNESYIWINQAAQQLLQQPETGGMLYIKDSPAGGAGSNGGYVVGGVVNNYPHFGLINRAVPTVYFPYSLAGTLFSDATLLYKPRVRIQVNNMLKTLQGIYGSEFEVSEYGDIETQLFQVNRVELYLMGGLLWLAILLLAIVLVNFFSLINVETEREKGNFGLKFSFGADALDLMIEKYYQLSLMLIVASVFWALIMYVVAPWFASEFLVDIFTFKLFVFSLCAVVLSLGLSVSIPFIKMSRREIQSLIRYQG